MLLGDNFVKEIIYEIIFYLLFILILNSMLYYGGVLYYFN